MNATRNAVAALLAAFLTVSALAQDPKPAPAPQDPKVELKQRMGARYPLLEQLRDAGKIGETQLGEVKLVKASHGSEQVDAKDASKGTVTGLVDAENKDRRAVYELIARQEKTTATEVAKQNGLRNVDKAKPDHWIEVKGQWVQRKSVRTANDKKDDKKDEKKDDKK